MITPNEPTSRCSTSCATSGSMLTPMPLPEPTELGVRRCTTGIPVPPRLRPAAIGSPSSIWSTTSSATGSPTVAITTHCATRRRALTFLTPIGRMSPRTSTSSGCATPGGRRDHQAPRRPRVSRPESTSSALTASASIGRRRGDLSVTDRVCGQVLTLPLHPYMDLTTLDRVIDGIRSFFAQPRLHRFGGQAVRSEEFSERAS